MLKIRSLISLAIAAVLLTLPAAALAQNTSSVTGTINLRQKIALPNNAMITVQLADTSRQGAPAKVLAQQTFNANGGQVPLPFTLQYDKGQITTNGTYIVQGNIKINGQLRYTTTTAFRVITQGNPTTVTVTMDAVGATLPNTAGATNLLLGALLLAVLLLLTHVVRMQLLNQPKLPRMF
jgi:putative lipoprotein